MGRPQSAIQAIRVLVVAEPIVAWGLERLVQSGHPRLEVAGTYDRASGCLEELPCTTADVVLVDLDGIEGTDGLAELFARSGIKILAISGSHDAALHDSAVLSGARGVVEKRSAPALLLKAIEKVHDGELWVDRAATSRIFMELARQKAAKGKDPEQQRIATLTKRERHSIAAVASDANAPRQGDRRTPQHQRAHAAQPSDVGLQQVGRAEPPGAVRVRASARTARSLLTPG